MKNIFMDNDLSSYYGDSRLLDLLKYNKTGEFRCVYCHEKAETREHIPSKIYLDAPYPDNVAVLPACYECNNSYSSAEQYLGCLIDYVEYKLNKSESVRRDKIKKAFNSRPNLKKEFEKSTVYKDNGQIDYIEFDVDKVKKTILKLGIGHAVYSLSELCLDPPKIISYKFLPELTEEELNNFNSGVLLDIIPEIGSRGATNMTITTDGTPVETWKIVQENQYRYLAYIERENITVRIVIGEYFYAEIIWNNSRIE